MRKNCLFPLGTLIALSLTNLACGEGSGIAASPPGQAKDLPSPANILLITIDTLRADHLSCYGYPRATSPVLDRLAAEGARFEHASAQWPKTGPSFASIFTATYPKDNHIVRRVGVPVPREFRMLAEVLRDAGYSNHAVVANGALARELFYDQGFDTYDETWKRGEKVHRDNRAEIVTRRAITSAVRNLPRDRPFFFWVHYIDPHFPYEPPEEWKDRFQNDTWFDPERQLQIRTERRRADMRGIGYEEVLDGRMDHAFYVARYDAEIAYADEQIGVLLARLETRGWLENTLTIITSDHGESLGEHEYYFAHGRFAFQTCLRVPLILHYPGVIPPRVETDPVELLSLAPTILEAAGLPLEDGKWMQGRSLLGRLRGREPRREGPSYAFAEAGYPKDRNWQKIVRDRRFKLLHAPDWGDQRWITGQKNDAFALYDLEEDPNETANVAARYPEELARLKRALHVWWNAEAFEVRLDEPGAAPNGELDEKTREQLKALGYLN